jgi:ATP-dependent helicase/nuclease subunit B
LIWLAPKQSTFQLERQILEDPTITGYTRLHILSFERLAEQVLRHLGLAEPNLLNEDGRCMVLRSLLARRRNDLKLFRASARLNGFARQLSLVLHEIQRDQLTPELLRTLADRLPNAQSVRAKLEDLALLLEEYLKWLREHDLLDAGCLLSATAQAVQASAGAPRPQLCAALWVDGFMDLSSQEWDLLETVIPLCGQAILTFGLDLQAQRGASWLSQDWVVRRNFDRATARLRKRDGIHLEVTPLPRNTTGRFGKSPLLAAVEQAWADPQATVVFPPLIEEGMTAAPRQPAVTWMECAEPEAEAICAARLILRHVRAGGRFREVAILLRDLSAYQHCLERIFARYEIPFFLDQREAVAHHPLAELTRNALRTVVNDWQTDDWFAALKSGLAPAQENEIDRLENEALARGWRGAIWKKPLAVESDPDLTQWLAPLCERLLPPFLGFEQNLGLKGTNLTGLQLTAAIRKLWAALGAEDKLRAWAEEEPEVPGARPAGAVHATVWTQLNAWLETVELAFAAEALPAREWLPILEAGLATLTVGVIPPALDQVVIGSIDRSRSLEAPLVLLLGMNEGVFPARPTASAILTDADRELLSSQNFLTSGTAREQLSRERHLAYLALTRARQRLVLTSSSHTEEGQALLPSPILSQLQKLVPGLVPTLFSTELDLTEAEHPRDILAAWPKHMEGKEMGTGWNPSLPAMDGRGEACASLLGREGEKLGTGWNPSLPVRGGEDAALAAVLAESGQWRLDFQEPGPAVSLPKELVTRLYGKTLRTSVSRLEQFAACPFRFFVHSGLKAEDRQWFEADFKEQGNFQHEVLSTFHEELKSENKRWKDITPEAARERIGAIATRLAAGMGGGLWQATEESRFLSGVLTASLQDFIATIVEWMRGQYCFEPVAVELPFGGTPEAPAWKLDLGDGRSLELNGRIDRIDLFPSASKDEAFCIVVDYKSSQKKLDPILIENGLQLQLLAYLNVLRQWPDVQSHFGVSRLTPAGVFYINLQGKLERSHNRLDALADPGRDRRVAYRHAGRFDASALRLLDNREDITSGDQFNYRLKTDGTPYGNSREMLATSAFLALLDDTERRIIEMGQAVYAGRAELDPYRKGKLTACDYCSYATLCRIDPWTHNYRTLRRLETASSTEEEPS